MNEGDEESSSINYQKTVAAQKERTTKVEKPRGFIDRLKRKYVGVEVESKYDANNGGSVTTSIHSGGVALHQRWRFDRTGNLTSVSIIKQGPYPFGEVSKTELGRNENGTFKIKEHKIGMGLRQWEEAFQTANRRLK